MRKIELWNEIENALQEELDRFNAEQQALIPPIPNLPKPVVEEGPQGAKTLWVKQPVIALTRRQFHSSLSFRDDEPCAVAEKKRYREKIRSFFKEGCEEDDDDDESWGRGCGRRNL